MWPFRKKQTTPQRSGVPETVSFSQVDTTDRFGDNVTLGSDDWIQTSPLNAIIDRPESTGLLPLGASAEETYLLANRLSRLRETIPIPDDGVYCPVCHIANIRLSLLRTPCPK